jgi:hypothetical protein
MENNTDGLEHINNFTPKFSPPFRCFYSQVKKVRSEHLFNGSLGFTVERVVYGGVSGRMKEDHTPIYEDPPRKFPKSLLIEYERFASRYDRRLMEYWGVRWFSLYQA